MPREDDARAWRRPPSTGEIDACRRCELWEEATQGVAGEGASGARVMLVGEQPGNDEDLAGRPFVGPAGLLLRPARGGGLPAAQVYITNAVKHFYFQLRGKRRIHKTPLQRHVAACHDWLARELRRSTRTSSSPSVRRHWLRSSAGGSRSPRRGLGRCRCRRAPRSSQPIASAILRAPERHRARLRATLLADLKRAARIGRSDG